MVNRFSDLWPWLLVSIILFFSPVCILPSALWKVPELEWNLQEAQQSLTSHMVTISLKKLRDMVQTHCSVCEICFSFSFTFQICYTGHYKKGFRYTLFLSRLLLPSVILWWIFIKEATNRCWHLLLLWWCHNVFTLPFLISRGLTQSQNGIALSISPLLSSMHDSCFLWKRRSLTPNGVVSRHLIKPTLREGRF